VDEGAGFGLLRVAEDLGGGAVLEQVSLVEEEGARGDDEAGRADEG
jgi:hypothetical protein